ncbi:MAG: SAM-dependent methyltransferase [Acidobacteria bacterium]|nr:SAM-dependent methyltransferase [Acidobacteriota bacterium]
MPTPSRQLALEILLRTERGGATLAERLAAHEVEALSPRDRAFLHEILLGTLRHRGALDHSLSHLSGRPLDELDPPVLAALRLGAYQLLRMRVPARAAVSESVDLVRRGTPQASGFVNAVLRRLAREGARPAPDPSADPLGWLTTEGSLPLWLAERWVARLGPDVAVARARGFLATPPTVYRLNPRVSDAEARAASLEPRPLAVPGAWLATAGRAADLGAEAVLYLQDQGSQLAGRLAGGPGLRLDACAAPGGKAMLMADVAGPQGRVVAAEASPRRLRVLAGLVRKWGASNVACVGADARRPPFRTPFAGVLLDAPCSGLGTIGRHPDLRWRAGPDDLPRHARRQTELLHALAPLVAPGGVLVYATCSVEPEENEHVLGSFLDAHPDLRPETPEWATTFAAGPFLRTRPEAHGGDAFFVAVLRRA